MRIRPGQWEGFGNLIKTYQSALEKVNGLPFAIYEVSEGAPSGTYLVFAFFKSLKDIDDMMAMEPKIMAAIGEQALKNLGKQFADIFASTESNIYAFSPELSHMPEEAIAADPAFWTPKAKTGPAPAAQAKRLLSKLGVGPRLF